jgi:hypothetical protein
MFVFCLLCAVNTIVFPTFQRSFQIAGHWGAYALNSSLEIMVAGFSTTGDLTEGEVDDLSEDTEFLSSASAFLYHSFDLDNSKTKIPLQQHLLLNPFLEKSTPPPEYHI